MYLRTCTSAEPITDIIDVLTRPDVPGKVNNPRLSIEDGVVIHWKAPTEQAGVFVQLYSIEWEIQGGRSVSANLTADQCSFKLPGITVEDKFSVSIRAIGNTGTGVPHFFNLANLAASQRTKHADTILPVALGSLLCLLFIFICGAIICCHRRRSKARRRQQQMEQQAHEQQQLRGNQQMMSGMDYSGLNSNGDSYHFDSLPHDGELGNGILSTYDGVTTILPSSSDPLTFMQPSIVREEILAGSVPTIIHRHHHLPLDQQLGDMHEMQTLIGVGGGGGGGSDSPAVQIVPNMTMTSGMSEETISIPSDSASGRVSEVGDAGELLSGVVLTSTPTKTGNEGMMMHRSRRRESDEEQRGGYVGDSIPVQLPIDLLYQRQQSPLLFLHNNNNNPKLVNRNVAANGNLPKIQPLPGNGDVTTMVNGGARVGGPNGLPVYSTVNKKGQPQRSSRRAFLNGDEGEQERPEVDHLIRRVDDGRLVHENGYEDEDDSRTGLLLNGSNVSGISVENNNGGPAVGVVVTKGGSSLATNPLWDTFRRPIVGPNG